MPGMSADGWLADTRISYNTVAVSYAVQVRAALAAEPYLRAALALFADMVRAVGGGPVARFSGRTDTDTGSSSGASGKMSLSTCH